MAKAPEGEYSLLLMVDEDQGFELKSHYDKVTTARLLMRAAENILGSDSDASDADPIPAVKYGQEVNAEDPVDR